MAALKKLYGIITKLSLTLSLLAGCQLVPDKVLSEESYGEYYLTLQQLSETQLVDEINKQQMHIELQKQTESQINYIPQLVL